MEPCQLEPLLNKQLEMVYLYDFYHTNIYLLLDEYHTFLNVSY